jgi:hypothetical protein
VKVDLFSDDVLARTTMLHNATLRRIDPPLGPDGEPVAVRCTLNLPTSTELRWMERAVVTATAVLYLPAGPGDAAIEPPVAGGRVVVELDGRRPATWDVVNVVDRARDVVRYAQVFLTPAG